jgi:hypothetical protein
MVITVSLRLILCAVMLRNLCNECNYSKLVLKTTPYARVSFGVGAMVGNEAELNVGQGNCICRRVEYITENSN